MKPNAADRLDLLRTRALSRDVLREPWLAIGLPVFAMGLVALLLVGRQKIHLSPWPLTGLAVGGGVVLGLMAGRWLRAAADAARLGVLGPLFCDPARRRDWILRRSLMLALPVLAAALLALPPICALAGAVTFWATAALIHLPAGEARAASARRPGGRALAWIAVAAIGALAAWRGAQDGAEALALGGVGGAALAGGLVWLRIEPRLLRLRLTTRRSLAGILLGHLRGPVLGGLAAGVVALAIGRPPILDGAVVVAVAVAAIAALTLLLGLTLATRGERAAETAFTIEAALIAAMAAAAGPFVVVWAAIRLTWLWRAARTRRWEAR